MHGLSINNIHLKYGLMLAPMAGVTDSAFRFICKQQGAEYMVSEMISAKAMYYGDKKTAALANITEFESPIALQIFGNEPEIMASSAKSLSENNYINCISKIKPVAIDINMGCPVPKVAGNGEGSALMRDPKKVAEIIRAIVRAISIPTTVKIRSGWDNNNLNAVEIAKIAEAEGVQAICVHGRTRTQMYSPPVNLDIIKKVKDAVSIPVIGNGGINSAEDAIKMYEFTGCDGIMIARGATGNPWIFKEIIAKLSGEEFRPPSISEKLSTAMQHIELMIENKGEHIGMLEARKHLAWYIIGLNGAAVIRNKINRAVSLDEMKEIVYNISNK